MAKRVTKATKTPKTSQSEDSRKLAVEAARLAEDGNCTDVVLLDLRGRSPVTDFYVIATGTSDRQMRSVADDICLAGKKAGSPVWHVAGTDSADWILLDFVDLVVHIFDNVHRKYYDLELMWGDAPRVRWQRRKKAAKPESTDEEFE